MAKSHWYNTETAQAAALLNSMRDGELAAVVDRLDRSTALGLLEELRMREDIK